MVAHSTPQGGMASPLSVIGNVAVVRSFVTTYSVVVLLPSVVVDVGSKKARTLSDVPEGTYTGNVRGRSHSTNWSASPPWM